MEQCWSVWIDEDKKTITKNKLPDSKQVFFKSDKAGIKFVAQLVAKGYKLG